MIIYLSALNAVSVNTDTPMETSLVASLSLHMSSPYGQDSTVYTVDVNGTHVMITNRSPSARLSMYVFGTFRMLRCLMNTSTRVPLPKTPTTNIIANTTGTMYVSGRFEYGTYSFSSYVSTAADPFMVRVIVYRYRRCCKQKSTKIKTVL